MNVQSCQLRGVLLLCEEQEEYPSPSNRNQQTDLSKLVPMVVKRKKKSIGSSLVVFLWVDLGSESFFWREFEGRFARLWLVCRELPLVLDLLPAVLVARGIRRNADSAARHS